MKHINFKSLIVLFLVLFGISPNLWAGKYVTGTDVKVKNQDNTWTTISDSYTSCNLGTVSSLSIEEYHIYFGKANEGTTCYCWLHYAVGGAVDEAIQGQYYQDDCWGKASIGKDIISSHSLKPGHTYTLYVWYEWKGDQDKASSSWCDGQYWARSGDSKYTITFTVAAYLAGNNSDLGLGWDDTNIMTNNTWTKDNVAANTTAQVKVKKKGTWNDAINAKGTCTNVTANEKDGNLEFTTGDHKSKLTISVVDDKINITATPYYTVTFNDGTSDVATKSVLSGSTTTAPNDPSKTGYTFDGWYNGNTKFTNSTTITSDITFTAKWTAKEYSITYKDQGGGNYSGNNSNLLIKSHTYDSGTTTLVPGTKTGYEFQGWHKLSDCSDAAVTTIGAQEITDNLTLYAKWQEIMSTITIQIPLSTQGSIDITGNKTLGITTGQQIVATPRAGYYLKEWQVSGAARVTDSKNTTTTVYTDGSGEAGTVQAVFEFRWVLRGSRSDNSGDEGMPGFSTTTDVFTFAADATEGTKTVTLLPNREYKFMVYDRKHSAQRGYGSNTKLDANVWSGIMNGNMHLLMNTAGYGTYTFKVKENGDYPQIYITNPASYQITMGTKFTTEGCGTGLNGGTLTAKTTENEQDFTVTTGNYVRKDGQVVFTATPKTGYLFEGFYSDVNCNALIQAASEGTTYTTTITGATTVYAKFSEILKEVTVIQGDGSQSTVKVGVASHPEITATAVSGKKFTGWSTNHVTVANANSKTTTITGYSDGYNAYSVTATFGELDVIYFKNIITGTWNPSQMYIYFYSTDYYDSETGSGALNILKQPEAMTRIEGTNIWYYKYDKSLLSAAIKGFVFSEQNMPNYDHFKACTAVYRMDYAECMNMFVLSDNTAEYKNPKSGGEGSARYFNKGFWKNYDAPSSGLYIHMNDVGETEINHKESATTYSTSIHLEPQSTGSDYDYWFYIGGCKGTNYSSQGATLSKNNTTVTVGQYNDVAQDKICLKATAPGSYKFIVEHTDGDQINITVEYPYNENDYRVVTVDNSDVHDNGYIYKYSSEEKDELASFYVKPGMQILLKQCSSIAGTNIDWTTIQTLAAPATTGIYNYKIHQDGNGNATLSYVGEYTGNFYIRTDVAAGGWNNYKENANNVMAKGAIFGYNNTYDYAYTNWAGANTSVRYTVANDYSKCISDTLLGDDVIGNDKDKLGNAGANIRFMWNSKNNQLKRDYIGGSNDDEQFLLIHGSDNEDAGQKTESKLYETADAASPVNNVKFNDDGNWIYSKEVYVKPGAFAALTAHFNSTTQFFHGAGNAETGEVTEYEQFVGGSGENRLKMKVIYNFKTNELVAGYIPDGGTIMETIDLNSDLLWIRTQQGDATPINFSSTDVQIENIHKIYGVLEFCKDSMTNLLDNQKQRVPLTNTSYNRINYWISFPFDVKVSEIFGVDGYGEKWVIQYYNGELRADIGWFQETSTFWEWLTLDSTMHAGKGYTLNIDPEYFDEPSDDIWKNVDSKVAFYFPSAANYNVNVIKQQEVTTKIPDHEYYRSVKFENNSEKDHKITDSYWNIIGTPAFQPTTISTASGVQGPKAIYVWKQGDGGDGNGYNIKETMTGFTFQPMRSYIVQYGGNVTWNAVSSIVKANQAPYVYADQKNYMVDLEFYFGEQRDHTYINLSDEATKEFKLNEDVMKMTNSGAPNIYSYAEGYDVAYNEVPMANQTINLGVIARKNGSYTFAMPKDFSGKAVLVDLETGEATDLNLSNYTVELNKGTYNNRFQLLLEVEAQSPTNMNPTKGEWSVDGKTKKLFINDNIYLINGGRIYNATGAALY